LTRLRIPNRFNADVAEGEYEVLYVMPAAGVLQIAPSRASLGQKEKPQREALQRHAGVEIECAQCLGWFKIDGVPLDEVRGWRCSSCRGIGGS
jgi:hypothetical protein